MKAIIVSSIALWCNVFIVSSLKSVLHIRESITPWGPEEIDTAVIEGIWWRTHSLDLLTKDSPALRLI